MINAMVMKCSVFVLERWQHQEHKQFSKCAYFLSFGSSINKAPTPLHSGPLHTVVPSLTPVLQSRGVIAAGRVNVRTPNFDQHTGSALCKGLTGLIFISSCELISRLCHTDAAETVSTAALTRSSLAASDNTDKTRLARDAEDLQCGGNIVQLRNMNGS